MERLIRWNIPESRTGACLVFVQDDLIPKEISAFFIRDWKRRGIAKLRVKCKAKHKFYVLTQTKKQAILGMMNRIARQYDYDFDKIVAATQR